MLYKNIHFDSNYLFYILLNQYHSADKPERSQHKTNSIEHTTQRIAVMNELSTIFDSQQFIKVCIFSFTARRVLHFGKRNVK